MVETGLAVLAEAGLDRLRSKGMALTSYLVELSDRWLGPFGFEVASPRDAALRGSHVSLRHQAAWQLCSALIDEHVVPDYREPDLVRFGLSALTTSFVDVHEAMRRLRDLAASGRYLDVETTRSRVT
jgi:kynureninase